MAAGCDRAADTRPSAPGPWPLAPDSGRHMAHRVARSGTGDRTEVHIRVRSPERRPPLRPSTTTVTGMNSRPWSGRRRTLTAAAAVALAGALAAVPSGPSSEWPAHRTAAATVSDPAALVHPRTAPHGLREPGTVGEFPGAIPLRNDPVEPRHQSETPSSPAAVTPTPTAHQRFSLTTSAGRMPLDQESRSSRRSAPSGARRRPRSPRSPQPGARLSRPLPGRARPLPIAVSLPSRPEAASRASTSRAARHPTCSSRWRAVRTRSRRRACRRSDTTRFRARSAAASSARRGPTTPALRGALQPALLVDRHLGRIRHHRRPHDVHGFVVRRLRDLRHELPAGRAHEGRDLLRQHRRRGAEPQVRGSGVVRPTGGAQARRSGTRSSAASASGVARRHSSTRSTRRCTTRSCSPTSCRT